MAVTLPAEPEIPATVNAKMSESASIFLYTFALLGVHGLKG